MIKIICLFSCLIFVFSCLHSDQQKRHGNTVDSSNNKNEQRSFIKDSVSGTNQNPSNETLEAMQVVKSEIIRLLQQINNHDWQTFHLVIEAPPFVNKGFNAKPTFLDKSGNHIHLPWRGDSEYGQNVLDLIFRMNQKEIRNQIIFFTNRDDYMNASIFISYSQYIEDAFQSHLPKSKKGKTIPWFKAVN